MEKEDLEELVEILQARQADAAREWEGKIALLHLQYRKQLRENEKQIEGLNAQLAESTGTTSPADTTVSED